MCIRDRGGPVTIQHSLTMTGAGTGSYNFTAPGAGIQFLNLTNNGAGQLNIGVTGGATAIAVTEEVNNTCLLYTSRCV